MKIKKNYLNVKLCKECGGKCCKKMPGIAFPEDFIKPLSESLLEAFESGNWAIDWYEGDPTTKDELSKAYYIRPKTKGVETLFDPSWGGECVFLNENGCKLSPSKRPKTCRMLEPINLENCIFHSAGTKKEGAIAWLPYSKVILTVAKKLGKYEEESPDYDTHGNFLDSLFQLSGRQIYE